MPVITVHLLQGRSPERKSELIRSLTRAASDTLEVPASSVRVILQEMAPEHFGIGGETAAKLKKNFADQD